MTKIRMVIVTAILLERLVVQLKEFFEKKENRELLNKLNFFPIADKDTGENAYITLKGIVSAVSKKDYLTLGDMIDDLLESAQMQARGNVGTAISNALIGFFRELQKEGISSKDFAPDLIDWVKENLPLSGNEPDFEEIDRRIAAIDGRIIARAIGAAAEKVAKGFSDPQKKTVIDVIDAASKEAASQVESGENDPALVLEKAIAKAREALAETKGKLHEGKVIPTVDAGAEALVHILEAFASVFTEDIERRENFHGRE